jgi:2-phospho-L-lactate guanylyltransferase
VQATVHSYDEGTRSGTVLLDDGLQLPFDAAAVAAGEMRSLRFGQRVRIRTAGADADQRVTYLVLATLADPG